MADAERCARPLQAVHALLYPIAAPDIMSRVYGVHIHGRCRALRCCRHPEIGPCTLPLETKIRLLGILGRQSAVATGVAVKATAQPGTSHNCRAPLIKRSTLQLCRRTLDALGFFDDVDPGSTADVPMSPCTAPSLGSTPDAAACVSPFFVSESSGELEYPTNGGCARLLLAPWTVNVDAFLESVDALARLEDACSALPTEVCPVELLSRSLVADAFARLPCLEDACSALPAEGCSVGLHTEQLLSPAVAFLLALGVCVAILLELCELAKPG